MKNRLLEERNRLNLTQEQFAKLGGIPKRTYCDYEYGISEPKASFFTKIAKAGIDVQYVLTGIRSQQIQATPPANYVNLNKKKIEKVMEDLTAEQQAEVIKVAEEKQLMNWYEIELSTLKKQVG